MLTRDSVETSAYHRIHLVDILTGGENEYALIQLSKKTTFLVQKIKENVLIGVRRGFFSPRRRRNDAETETAARFIAAAAYRSVPKHAAFTVNQQRSPLLAARLMRLAW